MSLERGLRCRVASSCQCKLVPRLPWLHLLRISHMCGCHRAHTYTRENLLAGSHVSSLLTPCSHLPCRLASGTIRQLFATLALAAGFQLPRPTPSAGPCSISLSAHPLLSARERGKERRLAFSAKTWLPESWVRCKNSKCRDPNSARMLLLPAMAQPQLLLEPLKRQKQSGHPLLAGLAPLLRGGAPTMCWALD